MNHIDLMQYVWGGLFVMVAILTSIGALLKRFCRWCNVSKQNLIKPGEEK